MLFFREDFANQESRGEQRLILEVFDLPMCCSAGVCGASVDKKLVGVQRRRDKLNVAIESKCEHEFALDITSVLRVDSG